MLFQRYHVVFIGVELEDVPPIRKNPLGWGSNKTEDKLLQPIGQGQPWNGFGVQADDVSIAVGKDPRENHKRGILRQEQAGEFGPAKIVVRHIKEVFATPEFVVEGHDLLQAGS